jgi:quercetin dioxygenase-like cupin family protein
MDDPIGRDLGTCWFAGAHFRVLHEDADEDAQEVYFPPYSLTPLHRHTAYAEHLFVIAGDLEAVIEQSHVHGSAGKLVEVPKGTVHAVQAGKDGVHLIAVSRPARFAALIRSLGAATDVPVDFERLMTESGAIGDEILAPPDAALQRLQQAAAR